MYTSKRTGVRFVLSNCTREGSEKAFNDWYDKYSSNILFPGLLVNCFRFENPNASGTDDDPRFAATYDIVSRDLVSAWPDTANSPSYPTHLFDEPDCSLVAAPWRATYALVQSHGRPGERGSLTGVAILLSDGPNDDARGRWLDEMLGTGLFYSAARFRSVDGQPDPADWLEVLETDQDDPLNAYVQALRLAPQPAMRIRERHAAAFRLVSISGSIVQESS